MKKLAIAIFVALLGLAFTAPAFALDHQFGGYWRVRMFNNTDFDGRDNQDGIVSALAAPTYALNAATGAIDMTTTSTALQDIQRADTRTRLYYTAVLNDNLKFVNKFEMDAVWGDGSSYGDLGADGVNFEVKNSYIDFNYGMASVKLGTHGGTIHRGFVFSNDFSGITIGADAATLIYAKANENDVNTNRDVQFYHGAYAFDMGDAKVIPAFTYVDQVRDDNLWFLGLDVDAAMGDASVWGTFIYNGGEQADNDVQAFLAAAGFGMGMFHGQIFYATGDDDATDNDIDAFTHNGGMPSYYWSEIMGFGTFDAQVSNGSPADAISNIMAVNFGITYAASEKLTLSGDLWYAVLAEDNAAGDDDLGVEVDLKLSYELIEGLKMDVIAAYLFAGDATTGGGTDEENPLEVGTQFSISF